MTARYAIYFAPARDSLLEQRAQDWLNQPDLEPMTVSARRYGFHATIKAPMGLAGNYARLDAALRAFTGDNFAVVLDGLAPRLLDGFLAFTTEPQPQALGDLAATVVRQFEHFRQPLDDSERSRRLRAPLTARQIELLDAYGYPYVLDQFLFHMTLTDRLPPDFRKGMIERARDWFADALAEPVPLDRLVVFTEPEPGAAFVRLTPDYVLKGA